MPISLLEGGKEAIVVETILLSTDSAAAIVEVAVDVVSIMSFSSSQSWQSPSRRRSPFPKLLRQASSLKPSRER